MNLTGTGIALRFLFALLLVLLSYNPSGHSYFHWVYNEVDAITPYVVIAGLVLLIGWGTYIRATLNSLGMLGIVTLAALLGCLVWLFIYWGWLSLNDVSALAWIIEILLAAFLTVGMCWSHLTRRMSGQVDVDVDELENN
jgi:O-antigen/teichoic acid export membrane protein